MSKSRSVKKSGVRGEGLGDRERQTKGRKLLPRIGGTPGQQAQGKREKLLPPIGGTHEEIQRTLVETMEGIVRGRIEPKEAFAIGRLCKLQLQLLDTVELLERRREREKYKLAGDRLQVGGGRRKRGRKGGPWVN